MGRRRAAELVLAIALVCISGPHLGAQVNDEQHESTNDQRPSLTVRLFGAVEWAESQKHDTPNSFGLGQFALFATSNLNERVSVLAEVVLEAGGSNTRVVTDLERLQITFRFERLSEPLGWPVSHRHRLLQHCIPPRRLLRNPD